MYLMVKIHPDRFRDIPDDKVFAQLLLKVPVCVFMHEKRGRENPPVT